VSNILAYLDQADWSALEGGSFPVEEERLRSLGESGSVQFVLSKAHLLENDGLTHGRAERERYLSTFPGVICPEPHASELLALAGSALADIAAGREPRRFVLSHAAARKELSELPAGLGTVRSAIAMASTFERAGLEIHAQASTPRPSDKLMAALGRGDADAVLHELRKVRFVSADHEAFVRQACVTASDFVRAAREAGHLMPMDKRFDSQFVTCVVPHLPSSARSSDEALRAIHACWSKLTASALEAGDPLLALRCHAAVWREQHYGSGGAVDLSARIDREHAVFASLPGLRVFTCDKRNATALRKVLPTSIRVVRTGRLAEVLAALDQP